MKKAYIYKITSPTGRIYVGSTFNFEKRKSEYRLLRCKKQLKIYNSILKYGYASHVFEILEECNQETRNEREAYWGHFYNVLSKENLNLALPKTEEFFYSVSQETREKIGTFHKNNSYCKGHKLSDSHKMRIGLSNKGKIRSEETKRKISEINKGKKFSQETIEKIKIKNKNKIVSKETREKLRIINLGKNHSEETKQKISLRLKETRKTNKIGNLKKVKCNMTNKIWASALEAATELNLSPKVLRNMLTGITINKTSLSYLK